MTYNYLTIDSPEIFLAPSGSATRVLLNPQKTKFMLIEQPSLADIKQAISDYGMKRLEDRWNELLSPSIKNGQIEFFKASRRKFSCIEPARIKFLMGNEPFDRFFSRIRAMTFDQQRAFIKDMKPKTIPEMLALYRDSPRTDQTGFSYLMEIFKKSNSSLDFFGQLTNFLFHDIAQSDYTLGTPTHGFHQPRVFEFLGLALNRGWILFPFISSDNANEQRALTHYMNIARYLNPLYCPSAVEAIKKEMELMKSENALTTHILSEKFALHLLVYSSYRHIEQSSFELFKRCLELVKSESIHSGRIVGFARRAYNALTKIHNSRCNNALTQKLHFIKKRTVSVDEFSSFESISDSNANLIAWLDRFSEFVRSNQNTSQTAQTRKTACNDFGEFLIDLQNPPLLPQSTQRSQINDFTDSGQTFRNFLKKKYGSPASCNDKLNQLAQFFEFVKESLRIEHNGTPQDAPWFPNPVDIKFDKFSEQYRTGTSRKSIAASILEEMRQIVTENDYAWARQFRSDWTYLANDESKQLEYVWCPSSAICLYLMLTIPLRGLQARLLDSGEGDYEIFDFEKMAMVKNLNQLPVGIHKDPRRKEGFIQVMASGLDAEPELVGLWICVNKTSNDGYPVPWVSNELLRHLRYQREWIFRYAHHPNMHSITDAQGHRNSPTEWQQKEKTFYCLFRDPSAVKSPDNSLPISKQKLLKLWGKLCLETQRRINSRAIGGAARLALVKPGTEDEPHPIAIHDLHTLRVSGITDLLDRGVPLNIVSEYIAGHATYIMTLWYDKPSPGAIRQQLMRAKESAGDGLGALPCFTESEIQDLKPFLLSNPAYEGLYTGFDALNENVGLIQVRQSGICPGTRCEEGGLTERERATPVPVGDRGPSCPQCRFWLTGPSFLLGQAIEGNQLILKIRKKITALEKSREKIMDAEDAGNSNLAEILRGNTDVEERQLNDMLTEWWHRMRFYESSIQKLDDYKAAISAKSASSEKSKSIVLLKNSFDDSAQYGYSSSTELELKHFLSTCAEILPEITSESICATQDIELAIGKFLAINDESELTSMFFKLDEVQRLTAANLSVELMFRASNSPLQAADLLEGKTRLKDLPSLQNDLSMLFKGKQWDPALQASPAKISRSQK